jgi:hypothetical protein
MKLMIKEHCILPMLFNYDIHSPMPISFHLSYCLAQTLTTFDFVWNKIDDQGAQHIANALQYNKVTSSFCHLTFTHYFTQALTTLSLGSNQIGDEGAKHIANALQHNKVRSLTSHPIIHSIFHTDTHHTVPQKQ